MTEPQRSPSQTAISVSMSRDLLAQIDERAKSLGLNRSQYFALLARGDVAKRGEMVLCESTPPYTGAPPSSASVDNAVGQGVEDAVAAVYKRARKAKPVA